MAKAFLIGDSDGGFTIVITEPVLVMHYSAKELMQEMQIDSASRGMASLFRELFQVLQGVNLDKLDDRLALMRDVPPAGGLTINEVNAVLESRYRADTLAQGIAVGDPTYNVDFCYAIDLPTDIAARGSRRTDPAMSIINYLAGKDPTRPLIRPYPNMPIRNNDTFNLEKPAPWSENSSKPISDLIGP